MTTEALTAAYAPGPADIRAAFGAVGLDDRPGPGEWTAREIVHHVAGAEQITRCKR